jgi:hypothetical protein
VARRLPNDFSGPANNAEAVTPSDATALPRTRGLYVGAEGDLKVDMWGDGDAIVFVAVPAGTLLPISVTKVYDTDTNAASIVALY